MGEAAGSVPEALAAFCERLRRLQRASGITQQDLASQVGVSPQQMADTLNGKIRRLPPWDRVRAIVEACRARAEANGRDLPPDLAGATWQSRYFDLEQDLDPSRHDPGDWAARVPAPGMAPGPGVSAGVRGFFSGLITDHAALFAGRDGETRRILDFVSCHEAGYVFVEALSGYGKTSLLANLVNQNRGLRYHFISRAHSRPGAGFDSTRRADILDSLCEQLNPRHIRGNDERSLEQEFVSLMSTPYPAKTVVVLDGIDELGPGDKLTGLMQKRLPAGLVIILSARTKGQGSYLPDIGLSVSDVGLHLTLPGLDTPAIASLLAMAGGRAAPLAQDQRFAQRLLAVSDGDPFYLRFLVEDVARGTLTSENVNQTPSGLEGYLDQQFQMLADAAHLPEQVQICSLLLEADALSRADLMNTVPGLGPFNFDAVLGGIHRFLLVYDGHYRFCHDRFRAYFWAKAGLG